MRFVILMLLTSFTVIAKAQDDVPDYRRKWESFSKLQEKDIRKDLGAFTYGGVDESMGKEPLRAMPSMALEGNTMKFWEGSSQVLIQTAPFDASKHKLFYPDQEKKYLQKIDNKPFFGDYGTVPKTAITAVTMILGKDTIRLPEIAFKDIFNPRFVYKDKAGIEKTLCGVYYSPDKVTMYIHLVNREASDKYEVTWVIRDKKYLKRVVDYDLP